MSRGGGGGGDNQLPRVSFDDEFRVRVLEKESIEHTQELEQESNQFATSALSQAAAPLWF